MLCIWSWFHQFNVWGHHIFNQFIKWDLWFPTKSLFGLWRIPQKLLNLCWTIEFGIDFNTNNISSFFFSNFSVTFSFPNNFFKGRINNRRNKRLERRNRRLDRRNRRLDRKNRRLGRRKRDLGDKSYYPWILCNLICKKRQWLMASH